MSRFSIDEDEFAVVSFPIEPIELAGPLTVAERAVLDELLAGSSNEEIAASRGTSSRTVANQIQSIFRKAGVHSRAELCAALAGTRAADRTR